jgi:hypothetical protein
MSQTTDLEPPLKLELELELELGADSQARVDELTPPSAAASSCINLISALNANPYIMSICFYEIRKILAQFPPAKNENKFIYGKLGEQSLIKAFSSFTQCDDLDSAHAYGSEYKNDCKVFGVDYSIKISKSGAAVTLINKNNKAAHVIDHNFIICHIEKKKLYIFPSSVVPEKFLNDCDAKIDYRPALFKYMDEHLTEHVYSFPELSADQDAKLKAIKEVNIYQILHKNFVEEPADFEISEV